MLKDVRNIWRIAADEFQWPQYDAPGIELAGFLGARLLDKIFSSEYRFSYRLPGEIRQFDAGVVPEPTPQQAADIELVVAALRSKPLPDGELPQLLR